MIPAGVNPHIRPQTVLCYAHGQPWALQVFGQQRNHVEQCKDGDRVSQAEDRLLNISLTLDDGPNDGREVTFQANVGAMWRPKTSTRVATAGHRMGMRHVVVAEERRAA